MLLEVRYQSASGIRGREQAYSIVESVAAETSATQTVRAVFRGRQAWITWHKRENGTSQLEAEQEWERALAAPDHARTMGPDGVQLACFLPVEVAFQQHARVVRSPTCNLKLTTETINQ